jgi:hypothetical protein
VLNLRTLTSLLQLTAIAIATPAFADPPVIPAEILSRHKDATGSRLAEEARPSLDVVLGRAPSDRHPHWLAGAPTVEVRRNYIYVEDSDGTLTIPYQTQDDVYESFEFAVMQVRRTLPDEFKFIYLFTSFQTGIGAYFYSPYQNNDSGIGQPRFDNSGASPLEGFVFMNYWRGFEEDFGQFGSSVVRGFSRSVFNQEAGHRWGTELDFGPNVGDGYLNQLLGRDMAHWSFFNDTGGSPMEGNDWRDNNNGTFSTVTDVTRYNYSDVDLYMMGLLAPSAVQPWFTISNPQPGTARDITGNTPAADSPPQIFNPITIRGTRLDFTVQDLTSRLGQRYPPQGQAPTSFRSVFVMLAGRNNRLSDTQKVAFETMIDGYAEGFRIGTRNLGQLDYTLMGGPPKLPIGGQCSMADECNPIEANLCGTTQNGTARLCTRGCSTPESCPAGWCCGPDGQTGSDICQPAGSCQLMPPTPDAGFPEDASTGPGSADAGTDPNPQPEACTCDLTFSCDENCPCDPECRAARGGCMCFAAAAPEQSDLTPVILVFFAASLVFFIRRRT